MIKKFVRIFNGLKAPYLTTRNLPEEKEVIVFGLIARGVHYQGWEEAILATKPKKAKKLYFLF